jgi:hypothetical protein
MILHAQSEAADQTRAQRGAMAIAWSVTLPAGATGRVICTLDAGAHRATLKLVETSGAQRELATLSPEITTDAHGFLHFDDGDRLRLTIHEASGRVVYARTSLIESLAVAGGSCERPEPIAP